MKKILFSITFLLIATTQIFAQTTTLFTEVPGTPFIGVVYSSIAFADVNGDNDQDVLITGHNPASGTLVGLSKLYTNDGLGNFTEVIGTPFDAVQESSIAFTDVNGDSYQDVLITGGLNGPNTELAKLYTNDGSGNFTEVIGTPFHGVHRGSIAFADVDGDNDQDVLITGYSSVGEISKLYTNDGTGTFTEALGTPFDAVQASSIAFADVDGDNDQDVLITGHSSVGEISKLYTNDGLGNFTEVIGTPFDAVHASSIAFADVDGDNDQDVLITGASSVGGISKLYTNDGTGIFTEVLGTPFEGVSYSSIAFADVNGDNDQDVLITGSLNGFGAISKLYTNDGTGNFTEVLWTPFVSVGGGSIAFADVNGDNTQDVLVTGDGGGSGLISKLYVNTTISTTCIQVTIVPDDNFEYYLETHDANGSIVPVGDPTSMGDGNANNDTVCTENIDTVAMLHVTSQNISDLTGIEDFLNLTTLYCTGNQITTLDLSNNIALTSLQCSFNQIDSLDVSNNTALIILYCGSNLLTYLNVNNNTSLQTLFCYYNQLDSLDVSSCVYLENFECDANQLTSLNLGNISSLQSFNCFDNQLSSLDVSNNIDLWHLWCSDNNITELDISDNINLEAFICHSNQLTSLDLRNGNNINMFTQSTWLDFTNNLNLTCIDVDDTTWATANWNQANGNIDTQHYFSSDCSFIPSSWNCVNKACVDPGDGSGSFTDSLLCISSCIQTEISDQINNSKRELIRIIDVLGKETQEDLRRRPLFYLYDDGTVEKRIIIE